MQALFVLALAAAPAALDLEVAEALYAGLDEADASNRELLLKALGDAPKPFIQKRASALIDRAQRTTGPERAGALRALLVLERADWPDDAKRKQGTLLSLLETSNGEAAAYAAICYARADPPLKTAVYKLLERSFPRMNGDGWERAGAVQALGELGPRAYPLFAHILRSDEVDAFMHATLAQALVEVKAKDARELLGPLRTARDRAEGHNRETLARAIEALSGAGAKERARRCIRDHEESRSRERYRCLARIDDDQQDLAGAEAVATFLLARLDDDDDRMQRRAASAIGRVAPASMHTQVAAKLVERLPTPAGRAAGESLVALGKPGMRALRKALQDRQPQVRRAALSALRAPSREANLDRSWAPPLYNLARRDADPEVRRVAASLLVRTDDVIFRNLKTAILAEKNDDVRSSLILALEPHGVRAVPLLTQRLAFEADVWAAAILLGRLGKDAASAAPTLGPLLTHNKEVQRALPKLGPDGLEQLRRALYDPDARVRETAADALGEAADEDAAPLAADLGAALLDPERRVRFQAALALRGMGASARAAAPDLVEALHMKHDHSVPRLAAEALTRIHAAGRLEPSLLKQLQSWVRAKAEKGRLSQAVIESLSALEPGEALPHLEKALDDESDYTRMDAVEALGRLQPPTDRARELIRGALSDDKGRVRATAAEALLRIGNRSDRVDALVILEKRKHAPLELPSIERYAPLSPRP